MLLALAGCGKGDSPPPSLPTIPEVTVEVSVEAIESAGNRLHYAWRATDGKIVDVDSSVTTWTLPPGPGLHFAYVLVSNGRGGYAERRVAVSTDSIGAQAQTLPTQDFGAPVAPAPTGVPVRKFLRGFSSYYAEDELLPNPLYLSEEGVYRVGAGIQLADLNSRFATPIVPTDARGSATFTDVPPGVYQALCDNVPCGGPLTVASEAIADYFGATPDAVQSTLAGRVQLRDGAPCGVDSRFFGKLVTARVTVLDARGGAVQPPIVVGVHGHFEFGNVPEATTLRVECEAAAPLLIPASEFTRNQYLSPRMVISDSVHPVVSAMSARRLGVDVGKFLPPPTGLPSDSIQDSFAFLSFKGIDTRLGACQYYRAIGAVRSCDAAGALVGGISFDDWKRKTAMAPHNQTNDTEYQATFVNRVDLNLTRNHHSVSHGPGRLAAYVCNHLGPTDETQGAVDLAIENAVAGRNLVACVAMDYGVSTGVNGGRPFTRFLIFGPDGRLLPSINLDGRAEKFMPGVCVACHSGDRYAGRYPENGSGHADIGAHFLPYDSGNFSFSSKPGLRESDQQAAIKGLNLNVLQSGPTVAISELVQGWYAGGGNLFNKDYLPASWRSRPTIDQDFYRRVYGPYCRTCHVAFTESLNFDHYANVNDNVIRLLATTCQYSMSFWRTKSMPNSLRTFDLFWGTKDSANDALRATAAFIGAQDPSFADLTTCRLDPNPLP